MLDSNITFVTGLWDLKREELDSFGRSWDHYINNFKELLKLDIYLVIFCDASLNEYINTIRDENKTLIINKPKEEFERWFPFFNRVEDIRNDQKWKSLAGWLPDSPQSSLKYYNPIVMSKVFMLNDARIYNKFNTDYFYWIDAGLNNTVNLKHYIHKSTLTKLKDYSENKFLFLSFPYEASTEVHGFEKKEFHRYCNEPSTYVCRGGFFGGIKENIHEISNIYYTYLSNTLNEHLMGTEESIFTIMSYNNKDIIKRYELESNGLIYKFFEYLNDEYVLKENITKHISQIKTSIYIITFNFPKQLNILLKNLEECGFLQKFDNRYVLNNSTDRTTDKEYEELFERYELIELGSRENLGICGGRQFIAEHFENDTSDYMMFFEDDMLLKVEDKQCINGFGNFKNDLYNASLNIIHKYNYDFLKINFTELYGDNATQWAWYNIPQDIREKYYPDNNKLPIQGISSNAPKTQFNHIYHLQEKNNNFSWVDGEIYYSNWPHWIGKKGNKKIFINTKWAHPYEQTWMSFVFQKQKQGEINSAVMLLSPIEHNRYYYYEGNERREN